MLGLFLGFLAAPLVGKAQRAKIPKVGVFTPSRVLGRCGEPHVIRRGRLFRKYVALFTLLVSWALLMSGGVQIYYSYQENKAALLSLQREKALAVSQFAQGKPEIEPVPRGIFLP